MSFCNKQEICHENGRRRAGEEWKNTPQSGENTFFPGKRSVHRVPGRTDAPLAGVFFSRDLSGRV